MKDILIAGIGNIFNGDDGFGCETVAELKGVNFPDEVTVIDFGIRSYDLAYALTNGHDAVILVDAVPQGKAPGTVYLIEPDVGNLDKVGPSTIDPHSMNPVSAIQMAQSVGIIKAKLFLVGCEPAVLENDGEEIVLSEPVRRAVPQAVATVRTLVEEILSEDKGRAENISN